ncbi:DUF1905 domain-containing protein [Demequina globuliformis]|uniref:DUF1905 domain-containing protein n=1 Tax=Demequina globuliformis TaxID=676202 RepID=UPI000782546D|nr:DUF1905 domain-containing protein [Demequina globuliformis]
MSDTFRFTAELWPWRARHQTWTFVTVPEGISDEIEALQSDLRRGFGAVKVRVQVGAQQWETSMFPSKEHAAYILPVKAAIRKAAGLELGAQVAVTIELIPA